MKAKHIFIFTFFLILLFTRLYNLPLTSRYTRDESSNLVDMHRIYVQKELTLIGPVDVHNTIIYPSLTFYMLMPFAVFDNFTAYSPAYGTSFYSVLSFFILLHLTQKINKKYLLPIAIFSIVSYPLVESSRWAWNPHLVPFISSLAIAFWIKDKSWAKFLAGIFFGLAFHLHYFSIVSSAIFLFLASLLILRKKFAHVVFAAIGFISTLIPFIIFDLRNPPGLFFGKFLNNNLVSQNIGTEIKISSLISSIPENIYFSLLYLSQVNFLAIVLGVLLLILVISDIFQKTKNLIYFLPVFAQTTAISLLPEFAGRYFLLAISFFIVWLIQKRRFIPTAFSILAIYIMTFGSLTKINTLLHHSQLPPGALVVEQSSQIIADSVLSGDLKNVNIATVGSPDPDPLATTYRHTLLVKEIRILSQAEYNLTDNLFVVSTETNEDKIKSDPSIVMNSFRVGKVMKIHDLETKPWRVYHFTR